MTRHLDELMLWAAVTALGVFTLRRLDQALDAAKMAQPRARPTQT